MYKENVITRSAPFSLFVEEDYLSAGALCELKEWSRRRRQNQHFSHSERYDAAIYAIGDEDGPSLHKVLSESAFTKTLDRLRVTIVRKHPWRVDAALHVHSGPSRAGWVHSDLSPGWFRQAGNTEKVCFSQMDIYHMPERPDVDEELERFFRRVVCILFLSVEEMYPQGGCLGVYESARQPSAFPSFTISPKENRLVAFEVSPYSYHAFRGMKQGRRESLIFWLHDSVDSLALKGWDESDVTNWR